MTLFSKQTVCCNLCGVAFDTTFTTYDGRFCGRPCHREYEWRRTLSVMGEPYRPGPFESVVMGLKLKDQI